MTKVLPMIVENKYFECSFLKKDNSIRKMKCIYELSKIDSQYILVYDVEKKGLRNVNLSTLIDLTIKGEVLEVIS